ncbi:MAG: PAS domain S-box protein [Candidatus Omnitrophica bacterium]|nr:PAS domain S-box protein [Candidatus Omnitrophota bacterium]
MKRRRPVRAGLNEKRHTCSAADLKESEVRYRRLFESAQDGILILDSATGQIMDVNPFLTRLLGWSRAWFLRKRVWEIGLFRDEEKSKAAFRELQREGYIRYEDLPLETRSGRRIDVEFVSNSYEAHGRRVIQCNIRDISDRKHAEVQKAILEATEAEQRRIGQDLHDGLCQQLMGVAFIAKALSQKLTDVKPDAAVEAAEIADLINKSVNDTRDLARGLSPVEIEAAGLLPALQNFASAIERFYKISCVFMHDEVTWFKCPFEPALAAHLYRIAQEAVSNSIRHGKAAHVVIALRTMRRRGVLTIQDDGIGIPSDAEMKAGLGLRSMLYRSKKIGARLDVVKSAGGGTVVTCEFPRKNLHKAETGAV